MSDVPFPTARAFVTGGSGYLGRNLIRALVARGVEVRALARSDASAEVVADCGAEPVRGDLLDRDALREGMSGCDTVFHSAAFVDSWCRGDEADRLNIDGTAGVLAAAALSGVDTVVHVSTEAVLIGGPTMVNADETWPLPDRPIGVYPRTKGAAEELCRRAAEDGQRVVIVRPRFIWGRDDSTLLPRLVEETRRGLLRWIDGGTYLISTCHVDNCVEGLLLAAEKGASGEAYFLTDGEPVVFREFIGEQLRSQGVEPPTGSVPGWLMEAVGSLLEWIWMLPLPGRPPLTRFEALVIGPCTVSDRKAREDLGYRGEMTVEAGLRDLRERAAGSP